MEKFTKRTLIAMIAIALGNNSTALGFTLGFQNRISYFAGVDALYLNEFSDDLAMLQTLVFQNNVSYVTTKYDWAYHTLAGIISCNGNDVTLDYLALNQHDRSEVAGQYSLTNDVATSNSRDVSGSVHSRWDDLSLALGHTFNLNPNWQIHAAAALDYSVIRRDFLIVTSDVMVFQDEVKNKVYGVGPQLDFDVAYHLPANFSLFARSNVALLVSHRKNEVTNSDNVDGIKLDLTLDRRFIMPKLGLKTGIGYTRQVGTRNSSGCCRPIELLLEVGWQGQTYLNALSQGDVGSEGSGSLSWSGPFVGLRIRG